MTTLSTALQAALQPECTIKILCKVVAMTLRKDPRTNETYIFVIFCDETGKLIDASTANKRKVQSYYRAFGPESAVVLTCLASNLLPPRSADAQYSYRIERNWIIEKSRVLFDDRGYFNCFVNIEEFCKSRQKAKMLVGVLIQKTCGPKNYDSHKQLVAISHRLELRDSLCRRYKALVWESVNEISMQGWMETFQPGDLVLLPYAQVQPNWDRSRSQDGFMVVTVHQPVADSQCVSERVERALTRAKHDTLAKLSDPRRYSQHRQPLAAPYGTAVSNVSSTTITTTTTTTTAAAALLPGRLADCLKL